ncbi:MAG: tRNA lysidine(34) synthetase TilS [Deltaproteobacteria bacterium]|nr:tRNA lysidine(34) synthetase TilS [Deltaproteobacteria bacterium]
MSDKKTKKKHFIKIIAETVFDFKMIEKEDKVLAAVSGGPDSVSLLLALLALKEKYNITLGIAHLNHMLRAGESLRDETFVKKLAGKLALPFHSERKNVKALAGKHRLSIEEAGRQARYGFFELTAANHGYSKIATGHNKDDNAELVLMNLLRGTGPKGLSGIPPIRGGLYIRPLIRLTKNEILDFLKIKGQPYVFDSSNKDMTYLRNNIRNRLIPLLKAEYNPEIIDGLDRLSNILKKEEEFLDNETQMQFKNCVVKKDRCFVAFSKTRLSNLHPAVLNRLFRKGIKTVKKDLKRITLAHINDIVKFCFNQSSGMSLDLPDRIRIYKNKDVILIKKEEKPLREIGKKEKQLRQMAKEK